MFVDRGGGIPAEREEAQQARADEIVGTRTFGHVATNLGSLSFCAGVAEPPFGRAQLARLAVQPEIGERAAVRAFGFDRVPHARMFIPSGTGWKWGASPAGCYRQFWRVWWMRETSRRSLASGL